MGSRSERAPRDCLDCKLNCGDHIKAERIWEGDDEYGGLVMHMSKKGWVDLEDFAEALRVARRWQKHKKPQRKN